MTKQFKTAINNKLKNIDIPGWVKYITVDRNGEVWGFELKPKLDNKRSIWINAKSPDTPNPRQLFLFNIDFDSTNWKNTLIALETIKIDVTVKLEPEVESIEGKCNVILSQPKSVLKFKLWQPADTFLVYQILEAKNIPDDTNYAYTSVDMEYDLLHPEKVVKNYEGIEIFSSKEDRKAFIGKMIKTLKGLFSREFTIKATEKDIGKNVETDCGVAELVAVTTDGNYVVTYKPTGSELFIVENAWFNVKSDCNFSITVLPDMSELFTFSV